MRRLSIVILGGLAAALLAAAPAQADPDNPCELAVNFLCRMVPIAPDLDHDIDLTVQSPGASPAPADQPPVDPAAPLPEPLPAAPLQPGV